MNYEGQLYRPPSESASLLLQITVGCSHNRCNYCGMYADKKFKIKPWDIIREDIQEGSRFRLRRVFLCDGDALIAPQELLLDVLRGIRESMPWVERVGTYGDARSILRKTPEELAQLKAAGLSIIYHGLESGDDETLRWAGKGSTAGEAVEAGRRVIDAGMTYSAMVMLGLGGVERSEEHVRATAEAINLIRPHYVGILCTMLWEDSPIADLVEAGEFRLPSRFGMIKEMRDIIADLDLEGTLITSSHASNYVNVRAVMPRDKASTLSMLDNILKSKDQTLLRPDFMRGL